MMMKLKLKLKLNPSCSLSNENNNFIDFNDSWILDKEDHNIFQLQNSMVKFILQPENLSDIHSKCN